MRISVAPCLQHLLGSKPCVILVASTTAPAGPEDVVGRSMAKVGGQVERFLAPVEPGNLLLLSYKDEVPIVSAPGCFRSAKPNVVDLVLPPMLARYRYRLGSRLSGPRRSAGVKSSSTPVVGILRSGTMGLTWPGVPPP